MESLQIIDKFCLSLLAIFLNMVHIFMQSQKNGKTFHPLFTFYHHDLTVLCVYLTFVAQYLMSFLAALLRPRVAFEFTC